MSLVSTNLNANTPVDMGAVLQCALAPSAIGLGLSILASGNVQSNVIINNGFKNFTFALTSSQNGSVSIQRYADQAGTIPVSTAITATLTANTANDAHSTDGIPYQSLIITVNNSGGSTATISNCIFLWQTL